MRVLSSSAVASLRLTCVWGVFAAVTGLVAAGCSPSSDPAGAKVVARVNGHVLTEGELEARANNIVALHLHKQPKLGERRQASLRSAFRKGYAKVWVEDRVLEDYAAREKIVLDPEAVAKFQQAAFRNFKAAGDTGYSDLLEVNGLDRRCWEDEVRAEVRRERLERHWAEIHPTNLPPTYADEEIARMEAWNARMALTNAIVHARATNVWEKLKAGADFVQTAKAFTELTDEIADDCEWGAIDAKFLSDEPELHRALKLMRPGEFTAPVEADGGLLIVRLDKVEPEEEVYTLSRIFFRMPRFLTPAPKDVIVKAAYDRYARRLFKARLAELVASAEVVLAEPVSKASTKRKKEK